MKIQLPDVCIVLLIGPPGSGKSTFARTHFRPTEILSSDFFRAMISDDETDQSVSGQAFELLHMACLRRVNNGKVTVVDATNIRADNRQVYLELGRKHAIPVIAFVFNLPVETCIAQDLGRDERHVGEDVVRSHFRQLHDNLPLLPHEGFHSIHYFHSREDIAAVSFHRLPPRVLRLDEHGPFDIIGDVHGCLDELITLLTRLGYENRNGRFQHPLGRKAIFLGDLVDRGPNTPGVVRLVMNMVDGGHALCVRGNHDDKLLRKLQGTPVQVSYGLERSLEQLAKEPAEVVQAVTIFLESLLGHYVLDDGKLVVAHAGLKEAYHGKISNRAMSFALYGETSGEKDEFGLAVRYHWAMNYQGAARVVYGHTATTQVEWINGTLCIDTGCVYGGELTALRYPELEIVQVKASREYFPSKKPLGPLPRQTVSNSG